MATENFDDLVQSCVVIINRDDLTDQVIAFARERIAHYSRDFFYANPTTITIQLVQGQVFYPVPDTLTSVTFVRLDYGNVWIWLPEVTYESILRSDANIPSTQAPSWVWAPYDSMIRLFPAPDKVYTLELTGDGRILAPVAGTDSNWWTQELHAAPLIRYATLAQLYLVRIKDMNAYQQCALAAEQYRIGLVRETQEKSVLRRIEAHW